MLTLLQTVNICVAPLRDMNVLLMYLLMSAGRIKLKFQGNFSVCKQEESGECLADWGL